MRMIEFLIYDFKLQMESESSRKSGICDFQSAIKHFCSLNFEAPAT